MPLVALIILLLIGAWLYREFTRARQSKVDDATSGRRAQPPPPRHQRKSDAEVTAQVRTLREALDRGDVNHDEAVGSLVRTCGLAPADARTRLGL